MPTRDSNIIHTPLAKSIDRAIGYQIVNLKKVNRLDEVRSAVTKLCHRILRQGSGIDVMNEIAVVTRKIWSGAEIVYHYDGHKKNSQMFSYLITLIGASIAYFAGIDHEYPISDEIEIPIRQGAGWISAASVAMGMDCFRVSQSNSPLAQMKLILSTYENLDLSQHLGVDPERLSNTSGRIALNLMDKALAIVSENYIVKVRKSSSNLIVYGLYLADRNGFGITELCKNNQQLELAATMLTRFGGEIIEKRSLTHVSLEKNAICNIRMLSSGVGDHHEMKITFMGLYEKGSFDPSKGITHQRRLHQQFSVQ